MEPLFLLYTLVFGIFAGSVGAMFGLGGGVFMIVFFILGLNLPAHNAVALSLLAVIASSSMAGSVYIRDRMTNLKLAMVLETCTVTGAVLGAFLALTLPVIYIQVVLGIVLIYASTMMFRGRKSEEIVSDVKGLNVKGEYYDVCIKKAVGYCAVHLKLGLLISLIGGVISGVVGIGGGVIIVPIMNLVMKVPIKAAAATSNFMVGVTAAASAFIFFNKGLVDLYLAVPSVVGIMIGAYAGTCFIGRVESANLRKLMGVVLIFAAMILILKAGGLLVW